MNRRVVSLLLLAAALVLAGCGAVTEEAGRATAATSPLPTPTPVPAARMLTIMTHDSFDVSEEVVAAFRQSCGCDVRF